MVFKLKGALNGEQIKWKTKCTRPGLSLRLHLKQTQANASLFSCDAQRGAHDLNRVRCMTLVSDKASHSGGEPAGQTACPCPSAVMRSPSCSLRLVSWFKDHKSLAASINQLLCPRKFPLIGRGRTKCFSFFFSKLCKNKTFECLNVTA